MKLLKLLYSGHRGLCEGPALAGKRMAWFASFVLALLPVCHAEEAAVEPEPPSGMVADLTGFEVNDVHFLKSMRVTHGAWLDMGVTYNPDNPSDSYNGVVTFNDRANTFTVNQFNWFLERLPNKEGKYFDLGFRADLLIGTDGRFTQAFGLDDQVVQDPFDGGPTYFDFAAPQLYVDAFIPVGHGLSAKIGHFYTPIGYEVVSATGNFFYSHAYTMQYGEPFTHTGILFGYPINANFSVQLGAVNGWDNWDVNADRFSALGGVTWTSDSANTTLTLTGITGDENSPGTDGDHRSLYSIVAIHKFLERFTLVVQHDHGFLEDNNITADGDARWYGINSYLFYDLTETLALGVRGEWFRDDEGIRVCAIGHRNQAYGGVGCPAALGTGVSFYAFTAGLNWKPRTWLTFRPEVRYDWADMSSPFSGEPFDNGTDDDQFLFALDAVVKF